MALITYDNKVALNENPSIPDINKVNASDMNEIKNAINNLIWPVGSYYETSDTTFNPNTTWGGTWVLEEDGTVLVSSSSTSGSIFNDTVGTTVGEEKHTLTANEMPSHGHSLTPNNNIYAYNYGGTAETAVPTASDVGKTQGRYYQTISASNTGGGQAHNIVQPSKIVNRWHRTE